jgi:hypothetical protein
MNNGGVGYNCTDLGLGYPYSPPNKGSKGKYNYSDFIKREKF